MVRSCIPSLPLLSQLFSYTSPPPPLPPQQQSCDLTSISYSSWRPPTCPQKCGGVCPHLPVSNDTRVNGRPVARPETQKVELLSTNKMKMRENVEMGPGVIKESEPPRPGTLTERNALRDQIKRTASVGKVGNGLPHTTAPAASQVKQADGAATPDLSSLFDDDDGEGAEAEGEPTRQHSLPFHAQNTEISTTQHSDTAYRASTADAFSIRPESDSDDTASVNGLYDVNLDDDESSQQDTRTEKNHHAQHVPFVAGGHMAFAPPSHSIDIDREAYIEMYASLNVVKDAAEDLTASVEADASITTKTIDDKAEADQKEGGTLDHVFFFKNDKHDEVKRQDSILTRLV